jgi:hypothetical protein
MTARFISSVLRGRSSALVAVALVATAVTTAQASTIFTSNLSSVTSPGGATTGNNFQIGYSQGSPAGAVSGVTNTSTGGTLGYNFVFANGSPNATVNATEANTIGGWGDSGVVKLDSNTKADSMDTQDDGAFLALDSVYQQSAVDVALTTVAGQTYTVTFDWAGDQQTLGTMPTTDSLTVGFTGNTSQTTGPISVPTLGFVGWTQVTDTFTASGTSSVLSFLASGTPSGVQPAFVLLDNITVATVTAPPPPTIPEPNSLLLLSTGLVGLGGFIRSRFNKN